MNWTAIAVTVGLILNALIVSFGYGILTQKVKFLELNYGISNKATINNRKELEQKIDAKHNAVLPECQTMFTTLSSNISEIKGKLDTLMVMMKNGK